MGEQGEIPHTHRLRSAAISHSAWMQPGSHPSKVSRMFRAKWKVQPVGRKGVWVRLCADGQGGSHAAGRMKARERASGEVARCARSLSRCETLRNPAKITQNPTNPRALRTP